MFKYKMKNKYFLLKNYLKVMLFQKTIIPFMFYIINSMLIKIINLMQELQKSLFYMILLNMKVQNKYHGRLFISSFMNIINLYGDLKLTSLRILQMQILQLNTMLLMIKLSRNQYGIQKQRKKRRFYIFMKLYCLLCIIQKGKTRFQTSSFIQKKKRKKKRKKFKIILQVYQLMTKMIQKNKQKKDKIGRKKIRIKFKKI
ncbi:hypothetical protein IMG5_167980 [Ichthyophthirius multifiliis]|uniref:Transmembrane protein n=1 Tax=Ichthyophthirius multifiliis TaxID=5932 RepID=G0R113_ICHMU|nr:hypothetical protein IMG5_167980 [Ichthyophthirius multifiliis]EGR28844.1 hypothetical protein IMG5_167980 [Ichthyophthirius multifiliis]|eukprot:XP_004030080.1 hypothetical protein IMG5_167980 [Ichthyophthirius multifiliis]